MKNLILTLDYELYGDGSGNVFKDVIKPTQKMLEIFESNNIKSTIFFEFVEYLKLKEEWQKGNTMGYSSNPAEAMEKQIQLAATKGHDIQLHIHPQWVNAKYIDNKWEVDLKNWRLGDFQGENDYNVKDLLTLGKEVLEGLIRPVIPNYKCIGLRAGGYNIMPSIEIFSAMKDLGFKYDSSIFPGGFQNGNLSNYDYQKVSLYKDFWWADELDLRNESTDKKEIIEIPIFSLPVKRWNKILTISKIKSIFLKRDPVVSPVSKEKLKKKNIINIIKFLFEEQVNTWDFCIFPIFLHKRLIKFIENNLYGKRKTFVLIGHPKNFKSEKNLKRFLKLVNKTKHFSGFKTLSEIYETIR